MFPSCTIPTGLTITSSGATVNVAWQGAATTYKLKYKRVEQEENSWSQQTMPGPGSSGGSGYFHDAAPVPTEARADALIGSGEGAAFSFSGEEGVYNIRAYNICEDGSDYYIEQSFSLRIKECPEAVTGLRVVTRTPDEIVLAWDDYPGRIGPYTVVWRLLDEDAHAEDEAEQTENTTFTFRNPEGERYSFFVLAPCTQWFKAHSDKVRVRFCPCGNGGTPEVHVTIENVTTGAGAGAGTYTHAQPEDSETWMVAHNLGFNPNVQTVDNDGNPIEGYVKYDDLNNLRILYNKPVSGHAYLS